MNESGDTLIVHTDDEKMQTEKTPSEMKEYKYDPPSSDRKIKSCKKKVLRNENIIK